MNSLYNIDKDLLDIIDKIDDEGFTSELEQYIGDNKKEVEQKYQNIGYVINKEKSNIDIIDNEIKRLTDLKKAKESLIKRMSENIIHSMQKRDIKKIDTGLIKLTVRKGVVILNITDNDKIPVKYIKTAVTTSFDKNKIKEEIKKGIDIEGAELKEGNPSLLIK